MNSRTMWAMTAGAGLLAVVALGLVMRGVSPPGSPDEVLTVPPDAPADRPTTPAKDPSDIPAEAPKTPRKAPLAPTGVESHQATESGLKYAVLTPGTGAAAEPGKTVVVDYTGWLDDGKKFDSSLDRNGPVSFTLGAGEVIRGWDEGLALMRVGGRSQLVIPPELAYGPGGRPPVIPPDATLTFELELVDVK